MIEKVLGKISSVEFGQIRDYPFLVGLHMNFKLGDGCSIGDGGKYTVNLSSECQWDSKNQYKDAVTSTFEFVNKILKDAKVNSVSELKNKPVEVTIENNCFKDFRILTEVL